MKAFVVGDPHIRRHAEFSKPTPDGLTEHLHAIADSLDWLCEVVEREQPDIVVVLGDVHDSPEGVDAQSLAVAGRGWAMLAGACAAVDAHLHFLVGNHDRYNAAVHTLEHYQWLGEHVWLHSEPTRMTIDGVDVLFLPWEAELPDLAELHGELGKPHLCFSHQELVGATLWGSRREDKGVDPRDLAEVVVQGHYHIPHTFANVYCPGSLVAKSFSDLEAHDSPGRGAGMLEVHGAAMNWAPMPNPHSPKFIDLHIPDDTDVAFDLAEDPNIRARLFFPQDDAEMAQAVAEAFAGRVRLIAQDSDAEVTRALGADVDVEDPEAVLAAYSEVNQLTLIQQHAGLELIREAAAATSGARSVLRPVRVQLQNFFAWEKLDLELPGDGLYLIEGDNGAGKTTLIAEPIQWAITGKTTDRQDGRADTVCRLLDPKDPLSGIAKPTEVTVTFRDEVGDREIVLTRRRHASPKVELVIDGENVAGHRQDASQTQIDDALRLDAVGLRASNFLVDGFTGAFSRLTPAVRMSYVERVLRLDVYDRARKLADDRRKAATRVADRAQGAVDAKAQAHSDAVERRDVTIPDRLADAQRVLREAQAKIDGQVKQAQIQVARERALVRQHEKERDAAAAKVAKLEPGERQWQQRLSEASQDAARLLAESRSAQVRLDEQLRLLEAGNCPTCGQPTEDCAIERITDLTDEQSQAEERWKAKAEEVRQLDTKYQRVRDKVQDLRGDERRASREASAAAGRLRGAEAHLESLRGGLVGMERRVGEVRAQQAEADAAVARAKEAATQAQADLNEANATVATWQYWVDALSSGGLRLDVLGRALAEVNDHLATLAADMLDFGVVLDNEGATRGRQGIAVNLTGTSKTLAHLSSGQRRGMDFVIQMALARMAQQRAPGALRLLVADEVMDTLDPENLSRVIDALEAIARDHLVLMTAHNPAMRALVPNRWTVAMAGTTSELTT